MVGIRADVVGEGGAQRLDEKQQGQQQGSYAPDIRPEVGGAAITPGQAQQQHEAEEGAGETEDEAEPPGPEMGAAAKGPAKGQ